MNRERHPAPAYDVWGRSVSHAKWRLHTGDVAVGPAPETDLDAPGTLLRGVPPDAANSLRALVDRELRARVIEANRAAPT